MTATRTAGLTPRFAEGDPMRVIGLAERYDAGTMRRVYEQWERLQTRLGEVRGRTDPAQFGLFCRLRGSPFEFEYLTGVMVAEDATVPVGFIERRLPARRHAVFTHRGHVSALRRLVNAIFRDWLPQSGQTAGGDPDFVEVYGEDFDPDRLAGAIEVWVPLQD